MNQPLYLERKLFNGDKTYSETELLETSNYIVILAEPGGGKTELLKSLAKQLGGREVTASVFSYVGTNQVGIPLVIDAFDELAKIDKTGIHKLLANVSKANPTNVIISSRSSEWDNSATSIFEQFIGYPPLVARLCEFDDSEQREIYNHHSNRGDFVEFQAEVARFALEPLLPNPQFLKMFADAYIESDKHFTNKRSIFTQAVTHLAREVNAKTKPNSAFPNDKKISLSSEIFAKLLLSGAEGIGVSEASENRMYPLVGSLLSSNNVDVSCILATRLFKPGDNADQHRPVHKIVAEYCAANYLIKRISNPSDPLTFFQCLPIIAPNSTVRDELRGLLGWIAALGDKAIEEAAIELDSYAVLANGDPSQLELSSKRLLLSRLREVEASDPYFRRGDFWRRFSVAGLFTQETIEEIKPIITDESDGHLRCLLLELLIGSKAAKWLVKELRQLVLASSETKQVRVLAKNCLLMIDDYDFRLDLKELIAEASHSSLNIAADVIKTLGPDTFSPDELEVFFLSCINLYPSHKERFEREIGERYFVKRLISCLTLKVIEWLLDSLSKGLVCTCGKKAYECDCRTGVSKIIGSMLDRYFELAKPPFEPLRVWQWIENLNFPEQVNTQDINSVKLLREDNALRQEIIAHVFGKLTDRDQIFQARVHKFGGHYSHAGLRLNLDDHKFIVDLAFMNDNLELWVSFMPRHNYHRAQEDLGPDYLRRHMRVQASKKPEFMRRWALQNRQTAIWDKKEDREWNFKHRRLMKRRDNKTRQIHVRNIKFVQENRALIEGGRHWRCLVRFARLVLDKPERIEPEFGDETLVRNALRNCLDFIEPDVPNLQKLAELQCASKGLFVETILFAACLEIMRDCGNLEGVKSSLLIALRTNLSMGFSAVDEGERDALRTEVDRLIFPDTESAEQFLRQYVEPQLAQSKCAHPEVGLLKYDEIFSPLRAKLSIEWLGRFNMIEPYALDSLFELAAHYGKREELNEIILVRCSEFLSKWPDATADEKLEQRRKFWFVRAFYFLDMEVAKPYLNWLRSDKNSVLLFNERSGRINRSHHSYWPELTSEKVEAILEAYFEQWPKVYLPSSWGTESPVGETAYRFLTELIWTIGNDGHDAAISVLSRLLEDKRYVDIDRELKSIQAEQLRKKALRDFVPPSPQKIVDLLDNNAVVTVEGLRQLVIQELVNYQKDIDGGEFNAASRFYTKDNNGCDIHLNEVNSVEIIAERLNLVLHPQSIVVTSEHQTKNQNRIDITATKMIDGKRRLLVIEAKGQWHSELYSAASAQLFERYSIHPDAEHQGIYLVIWFGVDEEVAGRKRHGISSAQELKSSIEEKLPAELKGLIDVFVLDVSKPK
ncbi:TPA: NACHT domain-containing protein [Photobacterium damselae]|uniref:NACHT domain-containing protein n=1 Tax=Photobacterium damselae TaxID=38293 RepID=UPI001075EAE8|nr:hypothetical protein [Photobacterium damselae]MBE8127713.1 hypothetical protein [Photobacterium damselae subsp. piscicida]